MPLAYRDLRASEFELLATIDRAEHIDARYVVVDGSVRLIDDEIDVAYVNVEHRHRGTGRVLIELLAERARGRGVTVLYISATPTRNTVDAYLHFGAVVADPPDRRLFKLEPDDVHLVLAL